MLLFFFYGIEKRYGVTVSVVGWVVLNAKNDFS